MSQSDRVAATAAAGGGLGALALLAGACCTAPIAASLLGVGGAMAAATLAPYRPLLLAAATALVAWAFWRARRAPSGACTRGAMRRTRAVLAAAAAAVLLSFALPWLA